ncbi:MAG TPA: ADYC domain-containing protein [Polyangiaceae bacterium]|nr:ADYC domain-containing protein [Polyangiaceae bacterium]
MPSRRRLIALCLAAANAAACAAEPLDESDGEVDPGVVLAVGLDTNGVSMNGVSMNGSQLVGVTADGATLSGSQLVGAKFTGQFSDGGTTPLRIDGARASGDVWFYQVSYPAASGHQPLCGVDATGAAREAIALAGRWDYRQGVAGGGSHIDEPSTFTFACRAATLAKCVELGYKPWASAGGVSLKNHHQACTRMLRADYCGDGTSYTVNGTPINLYDNVGVQADTESWAIEAEWTPAGARFVASATDTRLHLTQSTAPSCYTQRVSTGVGALAHFSTGTLLMSEYKP